MINTIQKTNKRVADTPSGMTFRLRVGIFDQNKSLSEKFEQVTSINLNFFVA